MNGKLNTDSYHYQSNKLHRDDVMRAAENKRLAQLCAEEDETPHRLGAGLFLKLREITARRHPAQADSRSRHTLLRRALGKIMLTTLLAAALLMSALPGKAQQSQTLAEPGVNELFHPALVDYRMGYYYQLKGDHTRAIDVFTSVADAIPGFGCAYAARGSSYAAIGEYALAVDDYTTALAVYPDFITLVLLRGNAYEMLGEHEQARADLDSATDMMHSYGLTISQVDQDALVDAQPDAVQECYQTYVEQRGSFSEATLSAQVVQLEAMLEPEAL